MNIKSSQTLVEEAKKSIETLNSDEVKQLIQKNEISLIDVRDIRELWKEGTIENSTHIPRGLLEFSLNPNGALIQNNIIDTKKDIVLFCAAGGRSALAAKTLKDMGFINVSHVDGGFGAMKQAGFKIKK